MTIRTKAVFIFSVFSIVFTFVFSPLSNTYAATSPNLGQAASFSILSSTYVNTATGTTINGDLGYTTGPAVAPTVNGITYINPDSKYTTAGTDQNAAKDDLNGQACTSLGLGAVNLDNVAGHATGVYNPGCYSSGGAMNITTGQTVTLDGAGTYIFKPNGALTTEANATVALLNGASACDVFWVPTAATTIGANTTFMGTDIDAAGITIGSTVNWTGRALAFGGTVSTDTDTITSSTCTASSTPTPTPSSGTSSSSSSPSSSTGGTTSGPVLNYIPPTIIDSTRVDADSINISWGPYSGTDSFIVQYGLANGEWLYSTNVTGFSTTLNDLPANQPVWVRVAPRDNNSIGAYGEARLVGGPRLPNAGFEPHGNNSRSYVSGQYSYKDFNASCSHSEELHFY